MPYCSFVLAELGADVIKIERPGTGDVVRGWDDAAKGLSSGFVWLNANKRDLALDLTDEEGRAVLRRLVSRADVFLENLAPGAAARLGFGPEELRSANPRLVYCSLSGYGQTGPSRDAKAYDLLVQGEAGLLLTNGAPDAPAKVGVPITDLVSGSNAAIAVTAALYERDRSGEGAVLDIAMFDSTVFWLGYYPHHFWHQGTLPPRSGMRHQYLAPYGPYLAADDEYVNLVIASADDWTRFCTEVADRPDWLDHPRFGTIESRRRHRDEVEAAMEELIAQQPAEYWFERLGEARLAFGRVRDVAQVMEHPQVAARDLVVQADSSVGSLPIFRFPLSDVDVPRRIPDIGEHRESVLREAGYSPAEIEALVDRGVV